MVRKTTSNTLQSFPCNDPPSAAPCRAGMTLDTAPLPPTRPQHCWLYFQISPICLLLSIAGALAQVHATSLLLKQLSVLLSFFAGYFTAEVMFSSRSLHYLKICPRLSLRALRKERKALCAPQLGSPLSHFPGFIPTGQCSLCSGHQCLSNLPCCSPSYR